MPDRRYLDATRAGSPHGALRGSPIAGLGGPVIRFAMLRRSSLLLVLTAAACFSDNGLSTNSGVSVSTAGTTATGPDATGTDATSSSTSDAPVTTSAATTTTTTSATTAPATTDELTSDALTTGATTSSTSEPGTTTGPDTGEATTDAGPYAACAAAATNYECFACCQANHGDWEVFRGTVAGCVCEDINHQCYPGCAGPLCNSDELEQSCFGCFPADDACIAAGLTECVTIAECAAFASCLEGAACSAKG